MALHKFPYQMTPEGRNLLQRMHLIGIEFAVPYPRGGFVSLDPESVELFMQDEDAYWAKDMGVEKEQFLAWRNDYMNGMQQCAYLKRNGDQCRHFVAVPDHPKLYKTDVYCKLHKAKR